MKPITRSEYSELVLLLLEQASFPGSESERVTHLKQLTIEIADHDPWTTIPTLQHEVPTSADLTLADPLASLAASKGE